MEKGLSPLKQAMSVGGKHLQDLRKGKKRVEGGEFKKGGEGEKKNGGPT